MKAKILDEAKIISKESINKGWSSDEKYCITLDDGNKYFLRIIPKEKTASRTEMFYMEQKVEDLGVSMCKPLEIGKHNENTYTIQTWVNGKMQKMLFLFLMKTNNIIMVYPQVKS